MTNDLAILSVEDGVAVVAYNNPTSRNSLIEGAFEAITAAMDAATADPSVGAVVLTGVGSYFCAGGDLNRLATRRLLPPEVRRQGIDTLARLVMAIHDSPKPVIAAVEGGAAGAGVSLALACDMVVAARESKFSVAYIKVGLTPDGGVTSFLSESLPRHLVTELCLTGDQISAERLETLGAVNRVVDPGSVQDEAVRIARRIARGPARATARVKDLCRLAPHQSVAEQLESEAVRMTDSIGDDEAKEGIEAFFGKRRPDYLSLRTADLSG